MATICLVLLVLKMTLVPWATNEVQAGLVPSPALQMTYYGCDAGILLLSFLGCVRRPTTATLLCLLLVAALSSSYLVAALMNGLQVQGCLVDLGRTATPIVLGVYLLSARMIIQRSWAIGVLVALSVTILTLVAVGVAVLPDSTENHVLYLPAYFGNQHNTCYLLALASISVVALLAREDRLEARKPIALIIGATAIVAIIVGWSTTTAALCVAIYMAAIAIRRGWTLRMSGHYVWLCNAVVWTCVAVGSSDVFSDEFGSGRFGCYRQRVAQLSERSLETIVFGTGYGSDLQYSDIWWWAALGSHNDILTTIFESGIYGLLCTICLWAMLLRMIKSSHARVVLIALMFSAFVSNGLVSRPLVADVTIVVCASIQALRSKNDHVVPLGVEWWHK